MYGWKSGLSQQVGGLIFFCSWVHSAQGAPAQVCVLMFYWCTRKNPRPSSDDRGFWLPIWWSWRELNSWPLECHTKALCPKPYTANKIRLLNVYFSSFLIHFDTFCISQSDFMRKDFKHFFVLNTQVTHGDNSGQFTVMIVRGFWWPLRDWKG